MDNEAWILQMWIPLSLPVNGWTLHLTYLYLTIYLWGSGTAPAWHRLTKIKLVHDFRLNISGWSWELEVHDLRTWLFTLSLSSTCWWKEKMAEEAECHLLLLITSFDKAEFWEDEPKFHPPPAEKTHCFLVSSKLILLTLNTSCGRVLLW